MSDIKFRKALSTQIPTAEAQEFLGHLKSAGVKEVAAKGMDVLSKNKSTLLGAAIGTAVASALQYQANKPKADGSPSTQRRMAEGQLAAIEKHHGDMAAKGQEPGFADEMSHARAKGSAEVSKVMEKHPVRGALMAAPVGAMAGAGISALAKNFMKQANGDMLQYYQDHPEKLKEKQKRDAKKEKKASQDAVAVVESWAQELARVSITKQAGKASEVLGQASKLWQKHGPAVKQMAGAAGKESP